jgi:hypothetical protein
MSSVFDLNDFISDIGPDILERLQIETPILDSSYETFLALPLNPAYIEYQRKKLFIQEKQIKDLSENNICNTINE